MSESSASSTNEQEIQHLIRLLKDTGKKPMTMTNHKCEVCEVNEPIGVASTIMPYSCAYCAECAQRFAQPKIVFECFFEDFGTNFDQMRDDYADLETFHHKKYISYREWAKWRAGQINADTE
jgi:hypothetical protein